ncbi:MAG TPA: pilus assembly protein TadG-related protein [Pirellula sp.]|nr:pilus assembly protein TadG-related protein [Pirellula sp.]
MIKKPNSASRRRGVIIPFVAIMMVVILGLAALSVDGGSLYLERRNTQVAADASADAAAIQLLASFASNRGVDSDGKARDAALLVAAAHGYKATSVIVNIPPKSGSFVGKNGYAEVLIKSNPPRFFSKIFSDKEQVVNSRSVAAGTLISTKASVLVLNPKSKNSLKLKGQSSFLEVGGDVIVNSKNKKAVEINKKAQLKAEHVLVSGGLSKNSKRSIDGEVSTGVDPTPDPFASLPIPAKGTTLKADDFKTVVGTSNKYNLEPGTYKELKFNKNDTVIMSPGIYYVDGGGVELKGESTLNAAGVMIFNTGKRGFKVSTKGNISISPPKSGPYQGISLFQDSAMKTKVEFSKQFHLDISGIIYAPNSDVKFKSSTIDIDSGGEDADWESEGDEPMEDDSGYADESSIGAAIVAAKLTVEKKTRLTIQGADIAALRPLLGVVE